MCLINLGRCVKFHLEAGRYAEAIADFRETLRRSENPKKPELGALCRNVLARLYVTAPAKFRDAREAVALHTHFNQLHAGCGQRIRYEKCCPHHGKVEAGAIVSGYAYAPEHYVVLDQTELEALRPAQERALSLERFLDPHQIDPALFSGRTLYVFRRVLATLQPGAFQACFATWLNSLREPSPGGHAEECTMTRRTSS